ncbi:MAG: hypothetical protein AB7E39_03675 [Endomicrobiaceae bacterium]
MKKIKIFIIIFLMLFNLSSSLVAESLRSCGNVESFDLGAFAVEQLQKNFTSILTDAVNAGKTSDNEKEKNNDSCYGVNSTFASLVCKKADNIQLKGFFSYPSESYCLKDISLTDFKVVFLRSGLTRHRMILNSYIAEIIPNGGFVISINRNSKG